MKNTLKFIIGAVVGVIITGVMVLIFRKKN